MLYPQMTYTPMMPYPAYSSQTMLGINSVVINRPVEVLYQRSMFGQVQKNLFQFGIIGMFV